MENDYKVVKRAPIASVTSNNSFNIHFPEVRKTIVGGKDNI